MMKRRMNNIFKKDGRSFILAMDHAAMMPSPDLKDPGHVIREAVAGGAAPQEIINEYMIKAMEAIGARFESGQVFVPNLLMSARAMRGALDILKPLMQGQVNSYIGRIVIGTVKGDLHDIGKNLVASMFEGCGFEVINLGVDVSSDKFISAALENKADIICMSALLTTTMNYMKEVIDALETSGLRGKVKVMVGCLLYTSPSPRD